MLKKLWKSLARTYLPELIRTELFGRYRAKLVAALTKRGLSMADAQTAVEEAEKWAVEHAAKV